MKKTSFMIVSISLFLILSLKNNIYSFVPALFAALASGDIAMDPIPYYDLSHSSVDECKNECKNQFAECMDTAISTSDENYCNSSNKDCDSDCEDGI